MQFASFGWQRQMGVSKTPRHPAVDPTTTCGAISDKRLIEATYEGQKVKIAPYALIRTKAGAVILHGVIVDSEGHKLNHYEPREYALEQFASQSVSADCFAPNTLFRSKDVVGDGEILCAVDCG